MKTRTFKASARVYIALQSLAVCIATESREEITRHLNRMIRSKQFAGDYLAMLRNLRALAQGKARAPYSIFAVKGNGKLPFVAFSVLPAVSCPGAGNCLEFCYSFASWRFAHAFGRQAQNLFLMRFDTAAIADEFARIASRAKLRAGFDLRLYVDGDFSCAADVAFWMSLLRAFPLVRAYGYSKSFSELLECDALFARNRLPWPANYRFNESSGHSHSAETVAQVRALPIYRGTFTAVDIGRKVRATDHGKRETNSALRAAFGARCFTCPGKCGACTPKGHACGSDRFIGIPIVIAMHS